MRAKAADRATIKDVATRAGVSLMTVSRVLNRTGYASDEARERVEAAAAALGYRPNVFARALPGARSFLVATLIDDTASAVTAELQRCMIEHCREAGYHLVVDSAPTNAGEDGLRAIAARLAALRPDGVIVCPPLCDSPEILALLEQLGAPFVRFSPSRMGEGPRVGADEIGAARAITDHILAAGHRRVAFVGRDDGLSALRLEGFHSALDAKGLAPAAITSTAGDFAAARLCVRSLLETPRRPTALVAATDEIALAALDAARGLGLTVPADLSVVGFGDIAAASLSFPPLTTIRYSITAMAAATIGFLINPPKTAYAPLGRTFGFELVSRSTVAPPP
ncbi:LacI family DNA-binding transcriptional regulator [Caulobacter segnis]|uniref:LacI family DNA-binding transcriptional regulator n=1 Tax=Caulobacter segnis TaxID=88688 RepID=UPI001CBA8758|nr:LacI family DNA-binding transcriptional regulator [Caulobacter segnis]UAL09274.1 LacI family transcriptional regulator [Caulobacter segnis]